LTENLFEIDVCEVVGRSPEEITPPTFKEKSR
jgi:hypothetical protein